jgi:hypothetical protein
MAASTAVVRADIITFGSSDIDRLDLAGTQTEGAFSYTSFGEGWELQTEFGNPPAALVTFFNDEGPMVGDSVFFSMTNGGLFSFASVDFATAQSIGSDQVEFTGVRNGVVTDTLVLSFSSTTFQTIQSNFSSSIDTLVIQVTNVNSNGAIFDNLVVNPVAIPEPTAFAAFSAIAVVMMSICRRRTWGAI